MSLFLLRNSGIFIGGGRPVKKKTALLLVHSKSLLKWLASLSPPSTADTAGVTKTKALPWREKNERKGKKERSKEGGSEEGKAN